MTYDELAATYLLSGPLVQVVPELPTSPARRLRDALEPIGTQGWWNRPVGERLQALGLSSFAAYVWGRAASLGVPESSVVVAAFGVFEPSLVTALYEEGRSRVAREDILRERAHGAAEAMDSVVDAAEADLISDPLLRALTRLSGLGRPLFSALRGLPRTESPGGRLWQAAEMVREHRGDGHIAALAAQGIDAVEANVLTEVWCGFEVGEYSASRGFDQDAIAAGAVRLTERGWLRAGQLTEAGRRMRMGIEDATDRSQAALIEALGEELETIIEACRGISDRLLAQGWFPPDQRKRAAG